MAEVGVAAGRANQARFGDGVAVQFGQAVDGAGEQVGVRMFAVPAFVDVGIVEAEIGAGIDDGNTVIDKAGDALRGCGVRQGGEDDIDIALNVFGDELIDRPEVRKDLSQTLAGFGTPGDRGEFDIGVGGEESGQFSADIAGDVDDRGSNHGVLRRANLWAKIDPWKGRIYTRRSAIR